MQRIAVIDYGMGNLRSVAKALEHVGARAHEVEVTSDPRVVSAADRVVFPGQGAMGDCTKEIARLGLSEAIVEAAQSQPFLGICIGLQALLDRSEEDGGTEGFGIIPGQVRRFPMNALDPKTGERLKIPHMGWNQVTATREHPLWEGIDDGERFYFVHSYYAAPADPAHTVGRCHYAVDFAAAAARENLFAVQFHPEKSQWAGLKLLSNFLRWDGLV
jgi:imidazole glycerol-phosphate synthase subunit HisH